MTAGSIILVSSSPRDKQTVHLSTIFNFKFEQRPLGQRKIVRTVSTALLSATRILALSLSNQLEDYALLCV